MDYMCCTFIMILWLCSLCAELFHGLILSFRLLLLLDLDFHVYKLNMTRVPII